MRRTKAEKIFYYTQTGFYEKTLEKLASVEEKVVRILHLDMATRNSDLFLLFHYWVAFDKYRGQLIVRNLNPQLTSPETIRRVRQKIQNNLGLFPPTDPEVIKARGIKAQAFRDWAVNKKRIENDL